MALSFWFSLITNVLTECVWLKIYLKSLLKESQIFCGKLLQTEKERIGFAPLKNYLTWWLFTEVSEKTKVRVETYHVQNNVTIRLNRSTERKYKRTNTERTMLTEKNPHPVPHDNSWNFKRANLAATLANL